MDPLTPGAPVLVMDVWADFGQFKKYYTTMSPLSFPLPPPTAVRGMLAAICGVDRQVAPSTFAPARLALRPKAAIGKIHLGVNLIQTKNAAQFARFEAHKPTNVEMVRNAAYRIYIHLPDPDLHAALRARLERHHSVYTLCFGNSESLANYRYLGERTVTANGEGEAELHAIVPTSQIIRLDFGEGELFTLTLPTVMTDDRVVTRYTEYLFERNGGVVKGRFHRFNRLDSGENLVFV